MSGKAREQRRTWAGKKEAAGQTSRTRPQGGGRERTTKTMGTTPPSSRQLRDYVKGRLIEKREEKRIERKGVLHWKQTGGR